MKKENGYVIQLRHYQYNPHKVSHDVGVVLNSIADVSANCAIERLQDHRSTLKLYNELKDIQRRLRELREELEERV